ERVARLFPDLDSKDFSARTHAAKELEKLQDLGGPFLREQMTKPLSFEVRRQVEKLLEKIEGPVTNADQLRELRAIEILEYIATPDARQVLQALAKGATEARLTQDAKASLERLDKRPLSD